jgi:N-acetylglucosamine-6-phosphate deacetylase
VSTATTVTPPGALMAREIAAQPAAWRRLLADGPAAGIEQAAELIRRRRPRIVQLVGPGWVRLSGERIAAVGTGTPERPADVELGADAVLVPGFVDQHMHGGAGAAFTAVDQDEAMRAVRFHQAHGTTTMVASRIAAAPDALLRQVAALADLAAAQAPGLVGEVGALAAGHRADIVVLGSDLAVREVWRRGRRLDPVAASG